MQTGLSTPVLPQAALTIPVVDSLDPYKILRESNRRTEDCSAELRAALKSDLLPEHISARVRLGAATAIFTERIWADFTKFIQSRPESCGLAVCTGSYRDHPSDGFEARELVDPPENWVLFHSAGLELFERAEACYLASKDTVSNFAVKWFRDLNDRYINGSVDQDIERDLRLYQTSIEEMRPAFETISSHLRSGLTTALLLQWGFLLQLPFEYENSFKTEITGKKLLTLGHEAANVINAFATADRTFINRMTNFIFKNNAESVMHGAHFFTLAGDKEHPCIQLRPELRDVLLGDYESAVSRTGCPASFVSNEKPITREYTDWMEQVARRFYIFA